MTSRGHEETLPLKATETIHGRGHENIQATHKTTFAITKDAHLTKRGDCIIAVKATRAATDLHSRFKEIARNRTAQIIIKISIDDLEETVKAWGSPTLSFTNATDLVVRKSDYVCGRTLAIEANKAAADLSKELVKKLKNPKQRVKISLTAETVP